MNNIVYIHKDRCTNEVFYVGIGSSRARAYDEKQRSDEWKDRISECYFDVEIVAKNLPKKLAERIEESLIGAYGIENLINKTLGGRGTKGIKHTDEAKRKISQAQKGRKKSIETISKTIENRRQNNSSYFQHIVTGEVIKGLKWACKKYNINYKREHQRITRNSSNRNFNKL